MTAEDRARLERIASAPSRSWREVQRARLVLGLADGLGVGEVARREQVTAQTARKWGDRYRKLGISGLQDRPRQGRPRRYSAEARCQLMGMACGVPADLGLELGSVWTITTLRDTWAAELSLSPKPSRSTVFRILDGAELHPNRVQMWQHSPDPLFREKVADICPLYLNPPEPGTVVLCIDEKTEIQALSRPAPDRPPRRGRARRVEQHYKRHGTRKLLCAFNPHTGLVYGEMHATRTAADLVAFMEVIAHRHAGQQVHVIWDNLNIHHDGKDDRWTVFNARHAGRFHFHYTPVHASWMNQVEMFFGILQRRVLRHAQHETTDELDADVLRFLDYWNRVEKKPFHWTFTGYPLHEREKLAA